MSEDDVLDDTVDLTPVGDAWTVYFNVGVHVEVPMMIEGVLDEADCVDTFKAWLANLNEDGSEPAGWDGWLTVDYVENGAELALTFRAALVTSFTCRPGTVQHQR